MAGVDLVVIGAGLAGLSAALAAARAGLSVRVVAKGLGAMHWSAGTIDVLGYAPGTGESVGEPLQHIDHLPEEHPYRLMGRDAVANALADFQEQLAHEGLVYGGAATPGENLFLPSPVGAARPTLLAPTAQLAGDLRRQEPMLMVGFQGMRDFYPKLIAENLTRRGAPTRAEFLPLDLVTPRRDSSALHLAHTLDELPAQERLAAALKSLVRAGERVGLPAVMGMDNHPQVLALLQAQIMAPIFEVPTLPPSAPGIRLYQALAKSLTRLGVRVEVGMEVSGYGATGRRIVWVETATSARPLRHAARSFLLATGGVLGGGFCSDHTGRFWEVVFDLPVTVPRDRSRWFRSRFLDNGGQPVFQGGVAVNKWFQPIDQDGQPVFDNLWAVGGLLAHTDLIRERSLEGVALATGMAAADAISQRKS